MKNMKNKWHRLNLDVDFGIFADEEVINNKHKRDLECKSRHDSGDLSHFFLNICHISQTRSCCRFYHKHGQGNNYFNDVRFTRDLESDSHVTIFCDLSIPNTNDKGSNLLVLIEPWCKPEEPEMMQIYTRNSSVTKKLESRISWPIVLQIGQPNFSHEFVKYKI
jgi:hypothetical protein